MAQPRPQQIYDWILEGVTVTSPSKLIRGWIEEGLPHLAPSVSPLDFPEIIDSSLSIVFKMLVSEQVRATAAGTQIFEVVGPDDDPILKGFGLPLTEDNRETMKRRQRAVLAGSVRQALLDLSPGEFEALWKLLVEHLGGRAFSLEGRSGDGGIDFTAEFSVYRLKGSLSHAAPEWLEMTELRSHISVIGQAKHTPNKTLRPAILRELVGTMALYMPNVEKGERKGSVGMLVTTGRFSDNADVQARKAGVILLDGEWVVSAIVNFGLGIIENDGGVEFNKVQLRAEIQSSIPPNR